MKWEKTGSFRKIVGIENYEILKDFNVGEIGNFLPADQINGFYVHYNTVGRIFCSCGTVSNFSNTTYQDSSYSGSCPVCGNSDFHRLSGTNEPHEAAYKFSYYGPHIFKWKSRLSDDGEQLVIDKYALNYFVTMDEKDIVFQDDYVVKSISLYLDGSGSFKRYGLKDMPLKDWKQLPVYEKDFKYIVEAFESVNLDEKSIVNILYLMTYHIYNQEPSHSIKFDMESWKNYPITFQNLLKLTYSDRASYYSDLEIFMFKSFEDFKVMYNLSDNIYKNIERIFSKYINKFGVYDFPIKYFNEFSHDMQDMILFLFEENLAFYDVEDKLYLLIKRYPEYQDVISGFIKDNIYAYEGDTLSILKNRLENLKVAGIDITEDSVSNKAYNLSIGKELIKQQTEYSAEKYMEEVWTEYTFDYSALNEKAVEIRDRIDLIFDLITVDPIFGHSLLAKKELSDKDISKIEKLLLS